MLCHKQSDSQQDVFDRVVHDNYDRVPDNFFKTERQETSMMSALEANAEDRRKEAEAIENLYGLQTKST